MGKFAKTHGETLIVVMGSGEFPLDMLRRDSACPDKEADAGRMKKRESRQIVLRTYSKERRDPELQRWQSFGWSVQWWGARDTFEAHRDDILGGVLKA